MAEKRDIDLSKIVMLVMDVDGVLTDGSIIINDDGSEGKQFSILDGHGIKMWHRAGFKTALISGRESGATTVRAKQLGIEYVMQGLKQKLEVFEQLLEQTSISAEQTAYIGDDLMDLPVITRAGFGVAVANAVEEVKECSDYVTTRHGGSGAVREVIEHILKSTGKWQELLKRYTI